jgi:predicted transcriptional regulator of viral defense system
MVADVLSAYIRSKEFNRQKLLEYAEMMGNSAIYKGLGFLVELLEFDDAATIASICKNHLKSGYSQLDPATAGNRLETQWHLWIPRSFNIKDQA